MQEEMLRMANEKIQGWKGWILTRGLAMVLCMVFFGHLPEAQAQHLDTLRNSVNVAGLQIPYTVLIKKEEGDLTGQVPIFFFLHGAGERGDDNKTQLSVGLPALVKSLEALKLPCYIIYAPQCPLEQRWVDTDWTAPSHVMASQMNPPLAVAFEGFDGLVAITPQVDRNRIYLTGLSMGGFAVWDLLERKPDYFTAAMPICGGGDTAQVKQLVDIPIWAFHGKKDKLVKVSRTTDMITAIKAAGGRPQMSIFEDQGHLCWNTAYQNLDAVRWLISQTRND
jgi:predicted peptidase